MLHRLAGVARAKMDVDEAMKLYVALLRAPGRFRRGPHGGSRGCECEGMCRFVGVICQALGRFKPLRLLEGGVAWLALVVWLDKAERKLWLVQKADAATLRVWLLLRGAEACMKTGLHDEQRSWLLKAHKVFRTGRAERS